MGRTSTAIIPPGSVSAVLENDDICVAIVRSDDLEYLRAYTAPSGRTDEADQDLTECWIIAKIGETFSISVAFEGEAIPFPGAGLAAVVHFDGIGVPCDVVYPESIQKRIEQKEEQEVELHLNVIRGKRRAQVKRRGNREEKEREEEEEGQPVYGEVEIDASPTQNGFRPFRFFLRETVDREVSVDNIDHFGQISVLVYWANLFPYEGPHNPQQFSNTWKLSEPIDERSKRGKNRLIASLGPEMPDKSRFRKGSGDPEDYKYCRKEVINGRFYEFLFNYAEIETLKAEGIAPRKRPERRPATARRPKTKRPPTKRPVRNKPANRR